MGLSSAPVHCNMGKAQGDRIALTDIDPFLIDAAIYLGAAVVAVPVFKRLRLGSVVGYLAAGALIGPNALGLVDDAESALHFAEFGVVLLLFVIGLELQPSRLWRLRTYIFGLGLIQVALTGVVIAAGLAASGWLGWQASVAVGGALALSSTAFAVQILRERGDLTRPYGDRAFSILLFQDLAIVPMLAVVAVLAPQTGDATGEAWLNVVRALGAIVALVAFGHFALGPLFHLIAATKSDEIFTAAALLVVVGSALLMQYVGLSMAMGAFIAGVLLAESEFRHQLETDIEPFRGLLLGLLFIAVGMMVSVQLIWNNLALVLLGTLGLVALKLTLISGLARLFGSSWTDAVKIGAVLSQGGEFGFVLFTVSVRSDLLAGDRASLLTAIVTLTMALTPLVMLLVARSSPAKQPDMEGIEGVEKSDGGTVIVVGFGRFGQIVARVLRLRGYELVLIDSDPERIRIARTFGNRVFFGDLRRANTLRSVGADRAKAVFLCADDPDVVLSAAKALRWRFPNILIFARAFDRFAELELGRAGADIVVREMAESGIAMARHALERFGDGEAADDVIEEFRRRDQQLLRLQNEYGEIGGFEKLREEFNMKEF